MLSSIVLLMVANYRKRIIEKCKWCQKWFNVMSLYSNRIKLILLTSKIWSQYVKCGTTTTQPKWESEAASSGMNLTILVKKQALKYCRFLPNHQINTIVVTWMMNDSFTLLISIKCFNKGWWEYANLPVALTLKPLIIDWKWNKKSTEIIFRMP